MPLRRTGTVGGDELRVRAGGIETVRLPVAALRDAFGNGLAGAVHGA